MSYLSVILADGAVGVWELGEGSGTTAIDQTGHSNGTISGSPTQGIAGIPGGDGVTATRFSASGGVAIPDVASQHVGDTFTLEAWIKRSATQGTSQGIISGNSTTPYMRLSTGNALDLEKQGVALIALSTATITDTSSYHHVVCTKSGATVKQYIDGADVTGTVTNATCANTTSWTIGLKNPSGENCSLTITYAAIYPTALSAATIANHYAVGSTAASAPVNTVAPVASGTATVGQTLSTTDGTWTGSPTPTFTYQWQRDNTGGGSYSNIGSATASSYTLVDADDACHVRCVVTGTNTSGNASANSNALGPVIEPAPTNSVAPVASGTAKVGSTLSVTNGTWANMGGSNPTYTYQWKRGASNIGSATANTYTLVDADDALTVTCVVTAHNTSASAGTATSNGIAVTEPVPTNSVAPAITGTAQVGSVLSSTTGTWAHMAGTIATYAYQWQRGGVDIGGATTSTYTLVDADDATNVRCVVTATNTGGASAPANSNAVAVTEPAPVNTVPPVVTGTTALGDTLTSTTGTWTHQGGTIHTYAYQWQRDDVDIPAATASTRVIAAADQGHNLRSVVTATDTGGASTPASSNEVAIPAASSGAGGISMLMYGRGRRRPARR